MKTDTIPFPNNPQHVENLQSIKMLKAQGFQGTDASLEESIFEYHLAWRELPDGEFLFIHDNPCKANTFDRTSLNSGMNIFKEYNWVNWEEFMSYLGTTQEEWNSSPFPMKISDLVNYHGVENIFGSSYWEGFKIQKN